MGTTVPFSRQLLTACFIVSCTAMMACGGYVARGRRLYQEGRYIESAELLERHERDLAREQPAHQAEYGAYRGLTMLMLGNYPESYRWMHYAYEVERAVPGSLRPEVRAKLDHGWRELLVRLPGAQPPPGAPPPGAPPPGAPPPAAPGPPTATPAP